MRGLYPIVDLDALEARGYEPLAFAEQVLRAKPALLQLRAKRATAPVTQRWLTQLRPLCTAAGTLLFANDRPDLAVLAGADGVHVGQADLSLREVRRFAPSLRVGVSTHDLQQLEAALRERPDYVAFGPVFPTQSKQNPDPVVGLSGLEKAVERANAARIPLVAIGGIDLSRAAELERLGVLAAVIGALLTESLAGVAARAEALQLALLGDSTTS